MLIFTLSEAHNSVLIENILLLSHGTQTLKLSESNRVISDAEDFFYSQSDWNSNLTSHNNQTVTDILNDEHRDDDNNHNENNNSNHSSYDTNDFECPVNKLK